MRKTSKLWFMFVNCSYIVSFVVKSPSGGKNPWKTAPANPRRSLFENCFKSWFDTVRWWGMSCAFEIFRNYWFRCFLRRVMVIFRQQKNFGPNVRYCVLDIMKNNCSYIVSFVVKSPSGGKNQWKTAPANTRRSLFENCCKSWFDTVRWWEMSCAFEIFRNYWSRCFLRRVTAILLQEKNFGPNVIYSVSSIL